MGPLARVARGRGAALLVLSASAGCGELRGATELLDAASLFADAGTPPPRDTGGPAADAATDPLEGEYFDEPIPTTHTIWRLDRASDPPHPRIVFVSSEGDARIDCSAFADPGWEARMPVGAILHVLELGSRTAGELTAKTATPPLPEHAWIGRTAQNDGPFGAALSGKVTLTTYDPAVTVGSFEATFPYPDEHETLTQMVRGTFVAPACAVEW